MVRPAKLFTTLIAKNCQTKLSLFQIIQIVHTNKQKRPIVLLFSDDARRAEFAQAKRKREDFYKVTAP